MRYKILLTFSFLMFLIASCTREVTTKCVGRTTFKCSFELNNDNSDQFAKLVNRVDIYIFDEAGILVKYITQGVDYLPEGYTVAADVNYGTYTAVLYGMVNENNTLAIGAKQGDLTTALAAMRVGGSRIDDLRFMLNSVTGHTDKDLGVAMHGMVSKFTVTCNPEIYDVPFIRNTNIVELNVSGLGSLIDKSSVHTRALSDVAVRIEGNNKAYLYDNTLDLELAKVIYAPFWQQYLNDLLVSKLSVLRLFKEHPMTLKVYNGNEVILQLNLTAEIMKSPKYSTNKDLDREDKFVVDIEVNTAGDFTIKVNGWTTTTSSGIIG